MAYIGVVSSTESSVKVRLYGLSVEYAGNDRVCTWYLNGKRRGTSKLGAKVASGGDYTFTNLSAGNILRCFRVNNGAGLVVNR